MNANIDIAAEWIDFLAHLDPALRSDVRLTLLLRVAFAGGALVASLKHLNEENQIAASKEIERFAVATKAIRTEFEATGVPIATI